MSTRLSNHHLWPYRRTIVERQGITSALLHWRIFWTFFSYLSKIYRLSQSHAISTNDPSTSHYIPVTSELTLFVRYLVRWQEWLLQRERWGENKMWSHCLQNDSELPTMLTISLQNYERSLNTKVSETSLRQWVQWREVCHTNFELNSDEMLGLSSLV